MPVRHAHKNPICQTCRSPIDDQTYRFLIVKDRNMKQELLSFHYFFPCWDVHYVCEQLTNFEISQAGFNCDESVLNNPMVVNNLRNNSDLWDVEII